MFAADRISDSDLDAVLTFVSVALIGLSAYLAYVRAHVAALICGVLGLCLLVIAL